MRLGVVGGKLQGTEAVYLAAQAGYETVLVDRRPAPPAAGLADVHVVLDVTADAARTRAVLGACDAVLPACEDALTLAWLADNVPSWGVPLLFDLDAYTVSSSKIASNQLFALLGVPRPRPWPSCGFPAVVKPSGTSGSEGVRLVRDDDELAAARQALEAAGHGVVVEEFVAGPSLSLEVLCRDGVATPLQATGLEFDETYDCKRVVAPADTAWHAAATPEVLAAFDAVAARLAQGLGLQGLMDVEVMVAGDEPKVLEIDARLPSQTPTAVLWSSGLNIVELLVRTAREGRVPPVDRAPARACVYQHVAARDGELRVTGEHVMAAARPLTRVPGFFGAHEALTDYEPGRPSWAATLITLGERLAEARRAADAAVEALAAEEGLRVRPEGEG